MVKMVMAMAMMMVMTMAMMMVMTKVMTMVMTVAMRMEMINGEDKSGDECDDEGDAVEHGVGR